MAPSLKSPVMLMPLTGLSTRLTHGSTPAITPAAAAATSSGELAATSTIRLLAQFIGEGRLFCTSCAVFQSENLLVSMPLGLAIPPIGSMATPIRGRLPPPPASLGELDSTWFLSAVMSSGLASYDRQVMLIARLAKSAQAVARAGGCCVGSSR